VTGLFLASAALAGEEAPPQSRPASPVDGVWMLEKIIRPAATFETKGGFIFLDGHYSTTVNYSHQGTQTNISQFGTYALQGSMLSLIPLVQVSTRGDIVVYDPEPPFTLEVTLAGDEMRGVAMKDGTTFVFRRQR
jgi:hypothetical protein